MAQQEEAWSGRRTSDGGYVGHCIDRHYSVYVMSGTGVHCVDTAVTHVIYSTWTLN